MSLKDRFEAQGVDDFRTSLLQTARIHYERRQDAGYKLLCKMSVFETLEEILRMNPNVGCSVNDFHLIEMSDNKKINIFWKDRGEAMRSIDVWSITQDRFTPEEFGYVCVEGRTTKCIDEDYVDLHDPIKFHFNKFNGNAEKFEEAMYQTLCALGYDPSLLEL